MVGNCLLNVYFHAWAENSDGSIAWEEWIDCSRHTDRNGITTGGINHLFATEFTGGTQATTWYLGLVDNAGFSSFSSGDTMASHSGWAESTAYSEGTRPAWGPGAPSGGIITNGTTVNFSINGTASIKGLILTTDNTKSGNTGTLFATGAFNQGVQDLVNGQTLKATCTITGVGA